MSESGSERERKEECSYLPFVTIIELLVLHSQNPVSHCHYPHELWGKDDLLSLILSLPAGSNMLIKAVYDAQEQKHYIIWEDELKLSEAVQSSESEVVPRITQMEIHNSGNMTGNAVYIGTTEGLYRVPVANCGRYTDCCSCVSARDPYCGYDRDSQSCVALSDDNRSNGFVQSLESGDIDACLTPTPTSQPVSEPTTSSVAVAVTTETVESSSSSSTTGDGVQATPSPVLVTSK